MVNKITTPPTTSELIGTVNEIIDDKQDTLVSGTNIKTINNQSLLGSGNIDIQGGSAPEWGNIGGDITAQTDLQNALEGKQDVISDLLTIRNGATLGATAVQPAELNGYATENWVSAQGYITNITSGDVTTALGYTPYNASNPNGYITNSALDPYALSADLASVATSGSYNDLSNKPTIPTVNNPTITFTQGGTTKGTITLNQSTNQTVAFDAGGSARNIGEIIQSTIPLTDAGLHLLDGSLISGEGIYSDFYDYMIQIYNDYPYLFCTETEWQQYVATDGACNRFVLDTTNKTIRLGLLTGFIEGTNILSDLGALTAAGLPNVRTNSFGVYGYGSVNAGTVNGIGTDSVNNNCGINEGSGGHYCVHWIDLSSANSIYGRSNTVQPQSIKVLYYIVIATSTKTDIEVDIDNIATDLNGKADVDFTNCNYIPMRSDAVHIVETYVNGTSWYRVYSDGWCEQGGFIQANNSWQTCTLLKPFVNTNYNIYVSGSGTTAGQGNAPCYVNNSNKTINSFQYTSVNVVKNVYWQACGYIR